MEDHLEQLNEKQKEAVLNNKNPLLILAGAGSGKTKTITHRIFHLVQKGVEPRNILAVTFTNKAAKEMRQRVESLLNASPSKDFNERSPFVSTFHSLGVKIIKENAGRFGLTRYFTIFDRNDSIKAIKESLIKLNIDPKKFEPAKILSAISKQKGEYLDQVGYESKVGNEFYPRIVSSVWKEYETILKKERALDFDDLILKSAKLLSEDKEVLDRYQNLWHYIHIDEYQDTNTCQYIMAKRLAEKHKNICVVGDIDQSIYTWRGANIKNILDFEKDYPEAKTIILEENYRSTKTILEAANASIEKNTLRRPKALYTKNNKGEKISLATCYDENDEASFIASKAKELIEKKVSPDEIAVLYRTNFQSRALEEAFLEKNIPYQILGTKFFNRKEVKDTLSYIRLALNPESLSDLKRIINVPARGLGKVSVLKILSGRKDELQAKAKLQYDNFVDTIEKIKEATENNNATEVIKLTIKISGIENTYSGKSDDDKERLANIKELVTLAIKYDGISSPEGILNLLEDAALSTDQDELDKPKKGVKLMTVHASKGLEFDCIFITGLEEGLFPQRKEFNGIEEEEEERRLFYVALTRARKQLFLSWASIRNIFGNRQVNMPSEFMTEIDERIIEEVERDGESREKVVYLE